jgi:uncharacterized Fe-S radical SAM superfamily protein PflX
MDQYHPAFNAYNYSSLKRRVFRYEVDAVIQYAYDKGMTRVNV